MDAVVEILPTRRRPKPPAPDLLQTLLRDTFGLSDWRDGQEEVIHSVLAGRDTLAIMPTGAGKSLCYQLPSLLIEGTTLVVSPLIALMKDQVEKLDAAGLDAEQLNSALSAREQAETLERIAGTRGAIIFATPERLAEPEFLDMLRAKNVELLVIDEAHCISQWGHDFRPAFLEIGSAVRALGGPTVLALTATATERVIDDVRAQLGLPQMQVINTGIYRSNLRYRVEPVNGADDKLREVLQLIREEPGSGIIYTATVKAAEQLHESLTRAGVDAALYHGRLPARERSDSQDRFMSGATRVMVATNAFGMGIDKADIRFIAHYQVPGSLEAYYQESGRAGRDGEPASCVLLYDAKDKRVQQFFLARRYPGAEELAAAYAVIARSGDAGITLDALLLCTESIAAGKIRVALKLLKDVGAVKVDPAHRYHVGEGEIIAPDFEALAADYQAKADHDRDVLERMISYAQSGLCRWKLLLDYFEIKTSRARCGHCDNCRNPEVVAKLPDDHIDDRVMRALLETAAKPADDEAMRPGDGVSVTKYGRGVVTDATDTQVTVRFGDGTTRTFLQRYVKRVRAAKRAA